MIVAVIGVITLMASMAQDFGIGIGVGFLLILAGGMLDLS